MLKYRDAEVVAVRPSLALRAGAVVAARNEAATLPRVVLECRKLGLEPITVVANGCRDQTADLARELGCRVIEHDEPLGHDVGRAVGALATPEPGALLFLDGDLPIPAEDLRPFLLAVGNGVDVALNRLDPFCRGPVARHPVWLGHRFVNLALGRPDLGCTSLTAIPHALSRRALGAISPSDLAVPPRALVRAVLTGLRVESVWPVDVITGNRSRSPGVDQLIQGDQLEALALLLKEQGPRSGRTDLGRRRHAATPAETQQTPAARVGHAGKKERP